MEETKNVTTNPSQETNVINGYLITEESAKRIINMNNEYQFLKGYLSGVAATFVGIGSGILVAFTIEKTFRIGRSICRSFNKKKVIEPVVIINKEPEVVKNGNEELQSAE